MSAFIYPKVTIEDDDSGYYFPVNYDRLRELLLKYPTRAFELAMFCGAVDLNTGLYKQDFEQDNMQDYIEWQLLEVVDLVASFALSGGLAPVFFSALMPLLKDENIKPLLGADWEWIDMSSLGGEPEGTLFQNRRFTSIFKDGVSGDAHWIYGRSFSDDGGETFYTRGKDSFVSVTFPCITRKLETRRIIIDDPISENLDPKE